MIPSLFPDGARVARLRNPVAARNSLALVAAGRDAARPLGRLAPASRRGRAAGAVLVYLAELVVVSHLFACRIAVAVVAALAWVVFERDRLEAYVALFGASLAAGLVLLWTFTRPALTDDLQPYSDRVNDGSLVGILVLIGRRWPRPRWVLERRACPPSPGSGSPGSSAGRWPRSSWSASSGLCPQERRDRRRVPRSEGRGHPVAEPPRRAQLEQPLDLVEGGVAARAGARPRGGKGAGTFEIARRQDPGSARSSRPRPTTCRFSSWPKPGRRLPAAPRPDRGRRDRRRLRGAEG